MRIPPRIFYTSVIVGGLIGFFVALFILAQVNPPPPLETLFAGLVFLVLAGILTWGLERLLFLKDAP